MNSYESERVTIHRSDLSRTEIGNGDVSSIVAVNAFGAAGVAVSLFDFFVVRRNPILGLDPFGVVVLLLGLIVEISARRTLGRHFSIRIKTGEEQKLIQSGWYRFIRHPLYLGIILAYFSAPIAWDSVRGALSVLPIIPLLLRRISMEEQALASRFGSEYQAYARRTKKLVPLLY